MVLKRPLRNGFNRRTAYSTGQLFSEKDLKFAPKDITGSNVLQNPFLNTGSGTMSPLFKTRLSIPRLFQGKIPHPGPAGT
jgi:hypothetical protein